MRITKRINDIRAHVIRFWEFSAISTPEAFAKALGTAEALMRQIRVKRRRPRKPVTMEDVLKAVVMTLVFHLSGFDYRNEQASPRARTARMLAALSVVLADTVIPAAARQGS